MGGILAGFLVAWRAQLPENVQDSNYTGGTSSHHILRQLKVGWLGAAVEQRDWIERYMPAPTK